MSHNIIYLRNEKDFNERVYNDIVMFGDDIIMLITMF